jgi:hypothetical protein
MTEDEQIAIETEKLQRLEKFLGAYEVANLLFELGGEALLTAGVKRVVAARDTDASADETDETEDDLNPTLRRALANTRQARGREMIKPFANKTRVAMSEEELARAWKFKRFKPGASLTRAGGVKSLNKSTDKPDRDFNNTVNAPHREFARIAAEGETLPWIDSTNNSRVVRGKVKIIKDARRKSREAQTEADPYQLNHVAESILRNRKAIQGGLVLSPTSTPAQRSITAKGSPSAMAVAKMLDVHVVPDMKMRAALPAEFQPKSLGDQFTDATAKVRAGQKAGHVKTWTDAGKTLLTKPNHEASPLDDNASELYDRNTNAPFVDGMVSTKLPKSAVNARTKNYVYSNGKHKFPDSEPQQFPNESPKCADGYGDRIEDGIGGW